MEERVRKIIDESIAKSREDLEARFIEENERVQPAYDVLVPHIEGDTGFYSAVAAAWFYFRDAFGNEPDVFGQIVGSFAHVTAENIETTDRTRD